MEYRQIPLAAPRVWSGSLITVEESLSYPPIVVGISTGDARVAVEPGTMGSAVKGGGQVFYVDNGDGTGNILAELDRTKLVTAGHRVYQIGKLLPLDATSMKQVDTRRVDAAFARMRAAGVSEADIALIQARGR